SQMDEQKTIAIVAVTSDLLRNVGNNVFEAELTRAVAAATDSAFIAVITSGISATTSHGGTSVAILQDLAELLAALTLDETSKVFLVTSSDVAKHWAVATTSTGELLFPGMTPTGGVVQGMPVLVSGGLTSQIVAVDASGVGGSAGSVELDTSDQTLLQ